MPLLLPIPIILMTSQGTQLLQFLPSALTQRELPPLIFLLMLVPLLINNLLLILQIQCSPDPFTGHSHNVSFLTLHRISTLTYPIIWAFRFLLPPSLIAILVFSLYVMCRLFLHASSSHTKSIVSKCLCWDIQFRIDNLP